MIVTACIEGQKIQITGSLGGADKMPARENPARPGSCERWRPASPSSRAGRSVLRPLRTENPKVTEEEDEQGKGGQEDRAQDLRAIRLHGALA